jgi:V8-like Glu-specific endopeptidase
MIMQKISGSHTLTLIASMLLPACALQSGHIDTSEGADLGVSQSAIYGGAREAGSPWTVSIVNFHFGNQNPTLCTGTLIAADLVLTARHCFDEPGEANQKPDVVVRTGPHFDEGVAAADEYEITKVSVPQAGDYVKNETILSGGDLAILHLERDITGIEPKVISVELPDIGDKVTIIGYGIQDGEAIGAKYRGNTQVAEVGDWLIRTLGDAWTCTGDSGGPLLLGDKLVGVTSAGRGGCERNAEHYYTAVAKRADFLREFVELDEPGGTDAGGTDPDGTDPDGTDPDGTDPDSSEDPGGSNGGDGSGTGADDGPGTGQSEGSDPAAAPPADSSDCSVSRVGYESNPWHPLWLTVGMAAALAFRRRR